METQNTVDSQNLPKQLSDTAWNSILPFLRDCRNVYVGNPAKCRHFLSAVLWIAKEGATWRALPKVYGNWNAIYRRFSRWCDAGVFQALHEHFHDVSGEISAILIDSTMVRAHSCAAGAKKKTADKRRKLSDVAEVDLPQNSIFLSAMPGSRCALL